ncbi:hypothetical protein [Flavivirga jejuensis]|uniref:Lipoprotein n=1 Tax=Flavivirga jejuensis TaxID=870487 RepID=A0ABT8WHS7_9FLAO|nr:hypothetical protein [Flavivirga jejuensis]MDO5972551.1 hypothetical protein [Flavivirga jejuensis]
MENKIKTLFTRLGFLGLLIGYTQCASTQKLENKLPLEIGDVYYQHWVAGVKGGGSGYNLFIPIQSNPKSIVLDSLYFKGQQVKLELKRTSVFVGRFISEANQKQDIIMSRDPLEEYGNSVPEPSKKTAFKLNDTECVVSYKKGDKTLYYKISNITKKTSTKYPSTSLNQ